MPSTEYPVQFSVAYPARKLNRGTTFFRIFAAIPILIVLGTVDGAQATTWSGNGQSYSAVVGAGGVLFLAPLLMILFRQKYPRWWFDWNLELQRFLNRTGVYLLLMDDTYPSTDDQQSVVLEYPYPDAARDLVRWKPLVKWFLAIPHFFLLFFLAIGAFFAVIYAWFAILFTGTYPEGVFRYVEGVMRWSNRVTAYAVTLVTDEYPPFRLAA
jgi:hypothetical protein